VGVGDVVGVLGVVWVRVEIDDALIVAE